MMILCAGVLPDGDIRAVPRVGAAAGAAVHAGAQRQPGHRLHRHPVLLGLLLLQPQREPRPRPRPAPSQAPGSAQPQLDCGELGQVMMTASSAPVMLISAIVQNKQYYYA